MKKLLCAALLLAVIAGTAFAQVDVEHRRTLLLQTGFAVGPSQEQLGGFGFFWFNENNYPWTNTALRIIFAGIYADAELSWFLPCSTNTALGAGLGGGVYVNSINPYVDGRHLKQMEFDGDIVNARLFINQTIPNPTPLPLNLRLTYSPTFQWFRATDDTRDFNRPRDFSAHSVLGEIRFGGIEPGLAKHRGLELYLSAETTHRAGFDAFGPMGAPYPARRDYQRLFASLAGKLPAGPVNVYARFAGGHVNHSDVLNTWKLGGNLLGTDDYALTLHGYYTRELFVESFYIANLGIGIPLLPNRKLVAHLYADNAYAKVLDPRTGAGNDWHNYLGVGAGLGFPAFWGTHMLLSYGYGVNAVRYDRHGGHEIGIALEKQF
ncbi:MAG: hypothetical protein FJ395_15770 [Verrucomicrobia bacterium]|nr:hypothetical protein [Verrucomicrobiota bacterium]